MKYLWIILISIFLVRIDDVLELFNKMKGKFGSENTQMSLPLPETTQPTELIPIDKDVVLQTSSKELFFLSLENFNTMPEAENANSTIELLRKNPTMFNERKDNQLETALLSFRNHLLQNNTTVMNFILEVMKSLTGENLSLARKVLSISLDNDADSFLQVYRTSSDSNCIIAGEFIDNLPVEEKINELLERKESFDKISLKEGYPDSLKVYAQKCLLVTNLVLEKYRGIETQP